MELRIKKDLKYIRHKSKIFSQTNVLNFENKINTLQHFSTLKEVDETNKSKKKYVKDQKRPIFSPRPQDKGPSLSDELDKINSDLKNVMNLIELPSIAKSPAKAAHNKVNNEAAHALKETISSFNHKCTTPELVTKCTSKTESNRIPVMNLIKKQRVLSEPRRNKVKNLYSPGVEMLNSKLSDLSRVKGIKQSYIKSKIFALLKECKSIAKSNKDKHSKFRPSKKSTTTSTTNMTRSG